MTPVAKGTAVLRSYGIPPEEEDHALRALRSTLHGFATLQTGHGFQWATDVDDSYDWLVTLLDRGLRATASRAAGDVPSAVTVA